MPVEGVLASKGRSTTTALPRDTQVYSEDMSNKAFSFHFLVASSPLTLDKRFPARWVETMKIAEVPRHRMLQVVAQKIGFTAR